MQLTGNTMQYRRKGNSVQNTKISEASTKKLQEMPTVIQGIASITEVDPMPNEDSRRWLEDFQWFPKITQRLPMIFEDYLRLFFNIVNIKSNHMIFLIKFGIDDL